MESYDQHSILKSRDITLATKVHLVKAMVFPVVMYGCESWTIKKAEHWRINAFFFPSFIFISWRLITLQYCSGFCHTLTWISHGFTCQCFWTVVLEKTLESPLDCREIQPVNPKGNQSWICIGRTDAKAETPILWPPYMKCWLIGEDPDAGKDWRQENPFSSSSRGWLHWLDGLEFEQAPAVGDGQGNLVCCSPRCCKEFATTYWLNWFSPKPFFHSGWHITLSRVPCAVTVGLCWLSILIITVSTCQSQIP